MSGLMTAVVAFMTSAAAIRVLEPICAKLGHVDHPGGRKSHLLATPLCGGLAIAATIIVLGTGLVPSRQFAGFAFGITVLLVLGALDDRKHVPTLVRMAMQALAVGVGMCFLGEVYLQNLGALLGPNDFQLGGHAIWFTIFAAVGVVNAVNMVDGVDGLAGGFSVMVIGVILSLVAGTDTVNVILLCLTIGSVLGFLFFNLRMPWQRHARIFLGDAGSLVLGFVLVWFVIRASQGPRAVMEPVTAVWMLGLPLADTVYLMGARLARGRSPLSAGRDHFHHFLLHAGLSPGWTLYAWLAVAGVFMGAGLLGQALAVDEGVRLLAYLVVFGVYCGVLNLGWSRLAALAHKVRPASEG